ncbi:hypothetical protein ZWY2020_006419 [Hordeum vulgare]|nr:hypothetical protein ZWY2020_006419 [Hordeum vulgare]
MGLVGRLQARGPGGTQEHDNPQRQVCPSQRICLSMSDFHPESWNPMWCVASILTGLLSFMMEDALTTGSIRSTDGEEPFGKGFACL